MLGQVILSRMNCYAGKRRAEVMSGLSDRMTRGDYLYLQFIEGCGYDVYELTPDEADQLAALLKQGAEKARLVKR